MRVCPLLLLVALSACGEDPPDVDPLTCGETFRDIPQYYADKLDLLFVVDTAPSMAEEQEHLATNLERFAVVIEDEILRYPADLHIGIISSDLGAGGFEVAGCSGDGADGLMEMPAECRVFDPFLRYRRHPDDTFGVNFSGGFRDAFACAASLGASTCTIRQPIAAALRALQHPANGPFLRDDAFLGIVVVTDGDDCSASSSALFDPDDTALGTPVEFRCFEQGVACNPDEPRSPGSKQDCAPRTGSVVQDVTAQAEVIRALKSEPSRVGFALASGGGESVVVDDSDGLALAPACTGVAAQAGPAVRLSTLADSFPQRSTVTSFCNEDLSDLLILYTNLLGWSWGVPCIDNDLDRDPETPGTQAECVVTDVQFPGTDQQTEQVIPECDGSDTLPCWHLEEDPINCPSTPNNVVLEVDRHEYPPRGTHTQIRCLTLC